MKLTGLALNQAPRLFCPSPMSMMFQRRSHSLASSMFYRTAGIVDLDRRNFRTSQTLFMAQRGPNYYCKFTQKEVMAHFVSLFFAEVLGLKPSASDKEIKMSYF